MVNNNAEDTHVLCSSAVVDGRSATRLVDVKLASAADAVLNGERRTSECCWSDLYARAEWQCVHRDLTEVGVFA